MWIAFVRMLQHFHAMLISSSSTLSSLRCIFSVISFLFTLIFPTRVLLTQILRLAESPSGWGECKSDVACTLIPSLPFLSTVASLIVSRYWPFKQIQKVDFLLIEKSICIGSQGYWRRKWSLRRLWYMEGWHWEPFSLRAWSITVIARL